MNEIAQHLSQLASIGAVLACAVLWVRRRSGWALVALIGELASLSCSLAFSLAPDKFASMTFIRVLWPVNACIFAFGLLGYAWFDTTPRSDETATAPGAQP